MAALSPKALAERWHCSPANIYNLIRRGDLPRLPISSPIRISLAVVEAMERCGLSNIEENSPSDSPTDEEPQPESISSPKIAVLPNGRRMKSLEPLPPR
jgi:hypothetical protein